MNIFATYCIVFAVLILGLMIRDFTAEGEEK
jgi:hypothetical protein